MARRRHREVLDAVVPPDPALAIDPARVRDILVSFLRAETTRAGRDRLVVGLSGGLDSAVAAVLAVGALGPDHVLGVRLPYRSSSTASAADARRIVDRLGIPSETVAISPMVDAYFASRQSASRHRQGNKMARERMSILYDLSEEHGGLVLGTSNKTELLLGYGTLHGDLAHALNPLGDLYKTQVRQLAAFLEVPASILAKAPSADLWPGQSDEEDLGMTYADADRILHHLFDRRASDEALRAMGFDRQLVRRIRERVRRSQFKRRMPLIAKVSLRTVGIDFRYPRDWGT
ncbi:MAG: NAD+ synthase [Acidobacteriota bacterium]|jgi:NAD+ synthase